MAREIPLQSRIDEELFRKLQAAAEANYRSLSAEVYMRLVSSFAQDPERGETK